VRCPTPRARAVGAALIAAAVLALPVSGHAQAETAAPLGAMPAGTVGLGVGDALSVVLVEASSGQVLIARDADVRRPIASAIKLVTALVVVEVLPPRTLVTVGDEVRGVEGSSYGLRPGEVRTVEDLLAGLLLRSGNDAAVALAVAVSGTEAEFVDRMELLLGGLGIDARPGSSSGLDLGDALSALELATVARAALQQPRVREVVGAPVLVLDEGLSIENRNLFLADTVGATGLKTGFTSAAGFTLAASALRDGRELVAVVLGASDDRERRAVAARLLDHGFAATTRTTVERSVTLRTTAGPVRFTAGPATITLAQGSELTVGWPSGLRPEDQLRDVALRVDGADAGRVGVERRDGRRTDVVPSLGRALADGAYAALRVGASAGGAGTGLR
jgi:serine-type D-Ala-D-Ala carboxypeptidase (penicillin-binding protein 5/6)